MSRWKQRGYDLGLGIIFPRLMLFIVFPCLFLFSPFLQGFDDFPLLLHSHPLYVGITLAVTTIMFLLDIAGNLAVSHYLRHNWTDASPYKYGAGSGLPDRNSYFRIRVSDSTAFYSLLKHLRHDQEAGPVRVWLRLDNLLPAPMGIVIIVSVLLLSLMTWVMQGVGRLLRYRLRWA